MNRLLQLVVVIHLIFVPFQAFCQIAEPDKPAVREVGTKKRLFDIVSGVLQETGRSGSLVLGWRCERSGDFSPPFRLGMVPKGKSPVQRLRAVFPQSSSLNATEDSTGLVRVSGGTLKDDLLQVRIKKIVFHKEKSAPSALITILNSPEILSYIEAHHIQTVPTFGGLYEVPSDGSPQLDGIRENIKLSEALDLLPLTYAGMWSYYECTDRREHRRVAINFLQWVGQRP